MIGLGSNRLSVCRRGGMSVTQAGRGGMEWLAGGRVPLWAQWWLPYSRQAGEALKAQFPTQWPTIRDYGFQHPEIVPYVNQWCPTYPNLILSLIDLGYQVYMEFDAQESFSTQIHLSRDIEFKADILSKEYYGREQNFYGSNQNGNTGWKNYAGCFVQRMNNQWHINNFDGWGTTVGTFNNNVWYHVNSSGKKLVVNGTTISSTSTTPPAGELSSIVYIGGFAAGGNGPVGYIKNLQIYDGTIWHTIAPAADNVLIDIEGGYICTKNGSGTALFRSISETPAA